MNYFLLSATKYVSPFCLSMKRANQFGGHFREGEHGTIIVLWKVRTMFRPDRDQDEVVETAKDRRPSASRTRQVAQAHDLRAPVVGRAQVQKGPRFREKLVLTARKCDANIPPVWRAHR